MQTTAGPNSTKQLLDSGASSHISSNASQLSNVSPYQGPYQVTVGNRNNLPIYNAGQGILPTLSCKLNLPKVFRDPDLSYNLLFVHQLTSQNNFSIVFDVSGYLIKDKMSNQTIPCGHNSRGLYPVCPSSKTAPKLNIRAYISQLNSTETWHQRLGHPSTTVLGKLSNVLPIFAKQLNFFAIHVKWVIFHFKQNHFSFSTCSF